MSQETMETGKLYRSSNSKEIRKALKTKYETFRDFNQILPIIPIKKNKIDNPDFLTSRYRTGENTSRHKQMNRSQGVKFALSSQFTNQFQQVKKILAKSPQQIKEITENPEDKDRIRQQLRKYKTPMDILRHYATKEHIEVTEQQLKLLEEFFKCQTYVQRYVKNDDLNKALQILYQILSVAVDLNQMNFFCLMIDFIAQLCFEMEDYDKSFFFYQQSRLVCTYNQNYQLKIDALIGMASNANKLKCYNQALILLKKGLQYAWLMNNKEKELFIYDLIGFNYFYIGNLNKSKYFHSRFTMGILQNQNSSSRSISAEILHEFQRHVEALENINLTSLFLQYFKLPIKQLEQLPSQTQKIYENYGKNGQSPRGRHPRDLFNQQYDAKEMIKRIIHQQKQFLFEIPDPVMKDIYEPTQHLIKKRKSRISDKNVFQRTEFYRSRFVKDLEYDHNIDNTQMYKFPLDIVIQNRLKIKNNQDWWPLLIEKLKLKKKFDEDKLKDKILNSNSHKLTDSNAEAKLKAKRLKYLSEISNGLVLSIIDPIK